MRFVNFYLRFIQAFSQIAILLTLILRTTDVNTLITDLISDGEDSIVNGIGNNEVNGAKVSTKTAKSKSQDKSKGKNLVIFLLAKFQAFGTKL